MRFDDKVAIVTGAASGIGQEAARQLLAGGGRVLLADCNNAALERTCRSLVPDTTAFRSQVVDVTRREDVQRMLESALVAFGRVDILIHSVLAVDGGFLAAGVNLSSLRS